METQCNKKETVCIVVLGDIGRSPRMQYHALSLLRNGYNVNIIGYGESAPLEYLSTHTCVKISFLKPYGTFTIPSILNYIFKTIWQSVTLMVELCFKYNINFLIVQNPPAVPTLLVCWLHSIVFRSKLIIDWHNYAHTIMALNLGPNHILVKITTWIESYFGKKSTYNICVTKAFKDDLQNRWGIKAHVLYDRPPESFKPISLKEKHDFIMRLSQDFSFFKKNNDCFNTIFTNVSTNGTIKLKENRPGMIVSSTSWTEDEDFSILLSALKEYEDHCTSGNFRNLPNIICVITGKGPLKEYYCKLILKENWKHVKIITPWLKIEEYPLMLASADLGICLHTSSSGLDLPMKVVDMFGCGLPVCAFDFKCLHELIKNKINSYTFKNSSQLSKQIQAWFENFPNNEMQIKTMNDFKVQLNNFQKLKWHDNWNMNVLPLLTNQL